MSRRDRERTWAVRAVAAALALTVGALASGDARGEDLYDVRYEARVVPTERSAHVEIRVRQGDAALRTLSFRIDPDRHVQWSGDGTVEQNEGTVTWEVPAQGGSLRYVFRIDHLRDGRSYDARSAGEWALFRSDDLVPPAAARTRKGARARAVLRLRLPESWSSATPYPKRADGSYPIENPRRGFDRPTGWILVGRRLGIVRETIAGVATTVAGPAGQGVRRIDLLALLRWTLPELREVLPAMPARLLLVGAGDPMWRGGLSGPNSVFIHADRPLMTPDGTSPVLHEILHVALPTGASGSEDWLVEGLAEFYSLALLQRSRTISKARHEKALAGLAERGAAVKAVRGRRSHGELTARAVSLLVELDRTLRDASDGERSLDDALRAMVESGAPLSFEALRSASEQAAGRDLASYFERAIFAAKRTSD
ncbi:MAG: hypothetical protein HKP30_10950 [Myxococcales bacterium]|nr:hypothetical protein [Myxococcales bacterium]